MLIPGLVKLESLKESPLEKNLKTGNGEVHDVPQRGPCWVRCCMFFFTKRMAVPFVFGESGDSKIENRSKSHVLAI